MLCLTAMLAQSLDASQTHRYALLWWALATIFLVLLIGVLMLRLIHMHWSRQYRRLSAGHKDHPAGTDAWVESGRRVHLAPPDSDEADDTDHN